MAWTVEGAEERAKKKREDRAKKNKKNGDWTPDGAESRLYGASGPSDIQLRGLYDSVYGDDDGTMSYEDFYDRYTTDYKIRTGQDTSRYTQMSDWANGLSGYLKTIGSELDDGSTYRSAQSVNTRRNEVYEYTKQAEEYLDYFKNHRDAYTHAYGEDAYNKIISALQGQVDTLGTATKGLNESFRYWSQFADEQAYNDNQAALQYQQKIQNLDVQSVSGRLQMLNDQIASRQASMDAFDMYNHTQEEQDEYNRNLAETVDLQAQRDQLQSLYNDAEQYHKMRPYGNLQNETDFSQYSAIGASLANTNFDIQNKVTYGRDWNQAMNTGEETGNVTGLNIAGAFMGQYVQMTDDEVNVYNYLLAKDKEEGTDRAEQYLKDIDPTLTKRSMSEALANVAKNAEKYPIATNIASVELAPITGVGALYSFGSAALGKDVDPNNPAFAFSRAQQAIRSTTSQDMGTVGSTLYYTGMSIADNLFEMALTGGIGAGADVAAKKASEKAILAMMGTSAATQATTQAFDQGATQKQALTVGLLAGAAEVVFEKIDLDSLIEISTTARASVIKSALKQSFVEGSEEFLTEIANIISDYVVMGDLSQYKDASASDIALQLAQAFAGGALSGGFFGAGASTMSNSQATKTGNVIMQSGSLVPLVDSALKLKGTEAASIAQQIADNKLKPTAANIGYLYYAYTEAKGDTSFLTQPQQSATQLHTGVDAGEYTPDTGIASQRGVATAQGGISASGKTDAQILVEAAQQLPEGSIGEFTTRFRDRGSVGAEEFASGYLSVYQSASNGLTEQEITENGTYWESISSDDFKAAYASGKMAYDESTTGTQAAQEAAAPKSERKGTFTDKPLGPSGIMTIQRGARQLGIDIQSTIKDENARAFISFFEKYYKAGQQGVAREDVDTDATDDRFPVSYAINAYHSGKRDAEAEAADNAKTKQNQTEPNGNEKTKEPDKSEETKNESKKGSEKPKEEEKQTKPGTGARRRFRHVQGRDGEFVWLEVTNSKTLKNPYGLDLFITDGMVIEATTGLMINPRGTKGLAGLEAAIEKAGGIDKLKELISQVAEKYGVSPAYGAEAAGVLKNTAKSDTIKAEEKPKAEAAPEPAAQAKEPESKQTDAAHIKLANVLLEKLQRGLSFNSAVLFELADKAYGGTMGEGVYTPKDAYDAMELAVNLRLIQIAKNHNGDWQNARYFITEMQRMLELLPTQTKRTDEQQQYQQFSTPPNIAYLAAWVANVTKNDTVLEPSAGIGGLAVFPKAWGASVVVNELSERRLELLKEMGFDQVYNENAEQINNVLPDSVKPTTVIMNPPFSSTAGRTATNKTSNAIRHIEQALLRLEDNGRLVAILGKGMADNTPTFRGWWNELRSKYTIRANISIDGSNYTKYGTSFGVQLVVIDKVGPQEGKTITGEYTDLTELPKVLSEVRYERVKATESNAPVTGSQASPVSTSGVRAVSDAGNTASARSDNDRGSLNDTDSGRTGSNVRESGQQNSGTGDVRSSNITEQPGVGTRADTAAAESINQQQPGETTGEVSGAVRTESEQQRSDAGTERLGEQVETQRKKAAQSDDGVYAEYAPAQMPIKGAKKHPAPLVESAAMAAVASPKITAVPNLPDTLIKGGGISDAQLENVALAKQAHDQKLRNGSRKGYFIGDGTGVGKGREISAIIMDNMRDGRTKAVWISKNGSLFDDAVRDWSDIGGKREDFVGNKKGDVDAKKPITADKGILFTTYYTLKSKPKNQKGGISRIDQMVNWLGENFDGVIAFDEVHYLGNAKGKAGSRGKSKPSEIALAGMELQRRLPNARVLYVSATAASDVRELAYAERLGLWGPGEQFSDADDFIANIGSAGIAAMELVARDMKAMGLYLARSISYNGVQYDTVQHKVNAVQKQIYDTMSRGWQVTMQNMNAALEVTGANKNGNAKGAAKSAYYNAMQRFYNQVLTSMAMPSVIADMKKELAAGSSCVLQVVNTNEAEQNRQLAKIKEEGGDLEDMDLTPRGILINYLQHSFPVNVYEEYTDEDGNLRSRQVLDSKGNPLVDKQAEAMRDALIADINQMSIPDGPLEMLFDAFGPEAVAEVTGRSRRVVPKKNERGETVRVEERRTENGVAADIQAFQNGDKHILIFSDAGGTGKSYHADLRAKNQEVRVHYLMQAGWNAAKAVQGFGRTHRSNQKQPPIFKLVTTDIMGQKRFTSTIARRLDQLGALTKGQRQTGSGMFGAKDNLEWSLAYDALATFYDRLGHNYIDELDGEAILKKLGLHDKFFDEFGNFNAKEEVARDMSTFLNRILALEMDEQNLVFNEFYRIFETFYDNALQAGTLDLGMENVKADKIEILDDKVVRADKSGATTNYVQAKTYRKPTILRLGQLENYRTDFQGLYRTADGIVRAVYRIADKTTTYGAVKKQYRMQSCVAGKYGTWGEDSLSEKATKLDKSEWASAWQNEINSAPEYDEQTIHMLTGTLLPIWNMLPQDGSTKAMRITADDGSQYLGRVINPSQIDMVLRQLGAGARTREQYTGADLMQRILKGDTVRLVQDRQRLTRRRVSNEWRIEIEGLNLWKYANYDGVIKEYIQCSWRYFIPTTQQGEKLIDTLIGDNSVAEVVAGRGEDDVSNRRVDSATKPSSAADWSASRIQGGTAKPIPISDIVAMMRHDYNIPVTAGHIRGRGITGQYNNATYGMRSKVANDLPTIAHELGHHFDNRHAITAGLSKVLADELVNQLPQSATKGLTKAEQAKEGFAEFIRKYLQNRDTVAIDYPQFYAFFEQTLDPDEMKRINMYADIVNAYYAMDVDNAQSSIRLRNEGPKDYRTVTQKGSEYYDRLYQLWIDANHGIKKFDEATGARTYELASNSAYADSVAYNLITSDLTDYDGQRIGNGLKTILKNINLNNRAEYMAFGEYLIVRHGPERLAEGQRIFADERKNSAAWMDNRAIELENEYPEFAAAADNLYEFQSSFLQAWGVDTGLVSASSAKEWAERWANYVPLNRAVEKHARTIGAKQGYANQNSTIKRSKGSGLDIVHPVDNIINNMVLMVNAGMRNMVMREITNAASNIDGSAIFLERVPELLVPKAMNMQQVKKELLDEVTGLHLSLLDENAIFGLVNGQIDDVLVQFEQGRAHGDIVTVMQGGERVFYKVNDPLLLESILNMKPSNTNGVLNAYGHVSRFMSSMITGNNVIWSLFSNAPRDLMTMFTYSKNKNPFKIIGGIASAYANKVKGTNADPLYKEYLAMGGGRTSVYTQDKNLAKKAVKEFGGNKVRWLNPIQWMDFLSDTIELGPRFSYYKLLRNQGATPHEAFYGSTDITVNFRRGGVYGRNINKLVPFFNAGVQGLDKFARWISCKDIAPGKRGKAIAARLSMYVAASAILAALTWAINSGDDDDKKNYAQLSNYTKNNFWCIPLGDGKYFSIPKPREIAVLSSLMEAMLEMYANNNPNALDGFYEYATDAFLPNVISNLAQGDIAGALGSFGIGGTFAYMVANRDFLGRPIIPSSMDQLETKDQYNNRTSRIAVAIGQALGISPMMVDYFFQQTLGGLWTMQRSLFPVGSENVDWTLGVLNTYVRDNQYSTDMIERMYDAYDKATKAHNSDPDNITKAIAYKEASSMTQFYSRFNKLYKDLPDTEQNRLARQAVLNMIAEYDKAYQSGYRTADQIALDKLCKYQGDTELMPSVMQTYIKDANGTVHDLNATQYVEFQTKYNSLYWQYVGDMLGGSNNEMTALAVQAAKEKALDEARAYMLKRMGASIANDGAAGAGISAEEDILFQAALDMARKDGKLTSDEVYAVLDSMALSDSERAYLYNSVYESDFANLYYSAAEINASITTHRQDGMANGKTQAEVDAGIKSSITSVYKAEVIRYYAAGNYDAINEIIVKLSALDLWDSDGNPYYTYDRVYGWLQG